MAEDLIRYDVLVQEALRGVVRKVVTEAAHAGLPGEHHFFIAFDTSAPGVRVSSRLRQKYPEEMTIVLQHQYWELSANDHAFEVGLSFGGVPEKLYVPFNAIKGFFDPSVQFGLQFDPQHDPEAETAEAAAPTVSDAGASAPVALPKRTADPAAEPRIAASAAEGDGEKDDAKQDGTGAHVVSLDAFRRKT